MDVHELSGRHEIRAVLERYCRAVDRGDLDLGGVARRRNMIERAVDADMVARLPDTALEG